MDQQNQNQAVAPQSNAAKFAFFYLLSLVGLVFMSVSTGIVIFQIINKYLKDSIGGFEGSYSPEALKFAISALIISAPIFYVISLLINKSLFKGELAKDSAVRRWLTYFILFASSVVMIAWAIATVNSFLGGELTTKFILKVLTVLTLTAGIFSFYLYDIKRVEVVGKKNRVVKIYFFISLIIVLAVFVFSLFTVESPMETRNRRTDEETLGIFSAIDNCLNMYYKKNQNLPDNLDEAILECDYFFADREKEKMEKAEIEYKKGEAEKYELCANFLTSNKNNQENAYRYGPELKSFLHDAGHQCLERKIYSMKDEPIPLNTERVID